MFKKYWQTQQKNSKIAKNHILETAANIKFTYKLVKWKIVNDRHSELAIHE